MMKPISFLLALSIASGLVAGCSKPEDGSPIPDRKPVSSAEIDSMPKEAQAAAKNAQKAGDYQSQRMQEMADAQRKAQGGQ